MCEYENRLVLFLDFLGFSSLVERSVSEPRILSEICSAIDAVRNHSNITSHHLTHQVTQFSDSLVLSFRIDEESGVFGMINNIALILINLAERGFLARGAVTVGQLLHTDNHVVGPALVRAYELESSSAKNPRVIVEPEVIASAGRFRADQHTAREEINYVRSYLTKDDDELEYIDYISWSAVVDAAGADYDAYPQYLEVISRLIAEGLEHDNPSVLRKYVWLHSKYLASIQDLNVPPSDPRRISEADFYRAIEQLPLFEEELRSANERLHC